MPNPFTQSVTFVIDNLQLCGVLHLPDCAPKALIVGCHGLMADKSSPKQLELANRCMAWGAAYFRFDHRGCGESEGNFETETTVENRGRDLFAAVDAAHRALGRKLPVGLFGSSLGGTVCLIAAQRISPFAMVTLAAPVRGRAIQLPDSSPESLKDEVAEKGLQFDVRNELSSIDRILIVHGSQDETVNLQNAHWIHTYAKEPKKIVILEGADHRISAAEHQQRFMQAAIQWFSSCYSDQCMEKR